MKAKITATKEQLQSIGIPLDDKLQQGDIVYARKLTEVESPKHSLYKEFYEIDDDAPIGNWFYTIPVEFLEFI